MIEPDSALARRPWLFWGTVGWALLALLVWQVLVVPALAYLSGSLDLATFDRTARGSAGIATTLWLAVPAHLAVIAAAVRLKRWSFADYNALVFPARSWLLVGAVVVVALLIFSDLTSWLAGRPLVPEFMLDIYRSSRGGTTFWIAAAGIVIAAPVFEEILVRGFMFRGIAASRLGIAGAIAVPSLLWAALHVQYDVFNMVQILVIGCVFAWLRWRSGSTVLTILMHMAVNTAALIQTIYWVEYAVAG